MSSTANEKDNSCNKDDEKHITCTDDMNNMHITCTEEVDVCACCGKEGSDLNICNKCQMVKYCNAACKKKHRSKHKKKCERRAAEIQTELYEEQLFIQPPLKEDCPICMLPLPSLSTGYKYSSCCGKIICSGCVVAVALLRDDDEQKCVFCRTPAPKSYEIMERYTKRMEAGDANAIFSLGCFYDDGLYGMTQDQDKAMELYHRAGELGCARAYYNIGNAYNFGRGVERDEKKAEHYHELAAMGGDEMARHNLGCAKARAGNWERALKHWLISAGCGDNVSVKNIQRLYRDGHATKEDYTKALLAYQAYLKEVRSEQRDKAIAFSGNINITSTTSFKCY